MQHPCLPLLIRAVLLASLPLLPRVMSAGTFESVPLKQARWDLTKAEFRMRIPDGEAASKPFRGVLVLTPGTDGDGRGLVDQPFWRELADRWHFALVGVHLSGGNDYSIAAHGSGDALVAALNDFAHQTSHPELGSSPLVMWGESAGGVFSYGFACWRPERVVAFVAVVDGFYGATATPGARHVPAMVFAEAKEAQMGRVDVHTLVSENRRFGAHWTEVAAPKAWRGTGKTNPLTRAFLDEEIALRLPAPDPSGAAPNASGFVHLSEVVEGRSWFGDPTTHAIAVQDKFVGQKGEAVWLPDETVARSWSTFMTGGKVDELPPTLATNPAVPPAAVAAQRPMAAATGAARAAHLRRAVVMDVILQGQPVNTITLPAGTMVNVLGEQAGQVTISYLKASATVERAALDLP